MSLQNPWVSYTDRSFQQIKQSLLTKLVTSNPEITDHSESNILVIIISMFAGIIEMLNYYIDNMARESFIATARRFSSMVKLVKLLDYRIKGCYPGNADVIFTLNPTPTAVCAIAVGIKLETANNIPFVTAENLIINPGDIQVTVGVRQVVTKTSINLGTTDGSSNQAIAIGTDYVDQSMQITINSVPWILVSTLGLSSPTDEVFIVEIDVDGIAYIVFGDGVNGAIPTASYSIIGSYETTQGILGNVDANTITSKVTTITLPGVTTITVTNPLKASGGSNYEDVESIRRNAPLSIRTLDRAVTAQDYEDIAILAPGVGKAKADFSCGKTVDIYIVPVGGGIAQSPLLITTGAFLDIRRMITTFVNILPSGETNLAIAMDVTLKYRADPIQSNIDIQNILIDFGSYAKQNINRRVNMSDIYALVDNLPSVDFVNLTGLSTKPYPRPIDHQVDLIWTRDTNTTCITKATWKLMYSSGSFLVIKNNLFIGTAAIGTAFTDPDGDLTFTIQSSAYVNGQTWTFTTYPYLKNIPLDDFSIPKVDINDLLINVSTQLIPSN